MASKCSWTQAPVTSQETRQLEGHFISHLQCKIEEGSHKQMLLPAAKAHKSVIFTWFLAIFLGKFWRPCLAGSFFLLLFLLFLQGDSWTLLDHFLCLGVSEKSRVIVVSCCHMPYRNISKRWFLGGGFKVKKIIPIWGRFPIWLIFFKWVETTN